MKTSIVLATLCCLVVIALGTPTANKNTKPRQEDCANPTECEASAKKWLDEVYEVEYRALLEEATTADWKYNTNINEENALGANAAYEVIAAYDKTAWQEHVTQYDTSTFTDPEIIRRLDMMAVLGTSALPELKFARLNEIVTDMTSIYSAAKVCPYSKPNGCDLSTDGMTLEPDIEAVINDPVNHSWEELQYYWKQWRDATGPKMRKEFGEYIGLQNEAALANSLPDASVMWLQAYTDDMADDEDFRKDLEDLWGELRPFYEKLHGFVRDKYIKYWNNPNFKARDPIPAHITGNMWAQTWQNSYKIVAPYPEADNPLDGVNGELAKQNYTVPMIFNLSNSFYLDLDLADMNMCYNTPCGTENTPENIQCIYNNPMVEKPVWDVVCHASAWDMYKTTLDDYRIKMCTETNLEDLVTVHHEMGHIEYFIQYKDKPLQFRDGANPGFHEAIGDTMALAVQTPEHLNKIGLLETVSNDIKTDINYLMGQAMERVMFLPFAYTIDQYRWALFNGTFSEQQMEYKWWELRERYQGLNPPTFRTEDDFDAGAKYHVAASVPYIRYFVSHILQYSFYENMCIASGQYNPDNPSQRPLHRCDFSDGNSPAAGALMKSMLQAGSSKPWPETLEAMTGSSKMSASSLVKYFAPLEQYLDEQIAANGIQTGWDSKFASWVSK